MTARRYADIFDTLGFDYTFDPLGHDALVALHASHSHEAIVEASRWGIPPIVVLTGTDYQPINERSRDSMSRAAAIVVLNPLAMAAIPSKHHHKTHVCTQSAQTVDGGPKEWHRLVWSGHLRAIKNPGMLIDAMEALGDHTALICDAVGEVTEPGTLTRMMTDAEKRTRGKFLWHGGVTHKESQRLISAAGALVVTSDAEGAPNVIAEAIANGTPVLARDIDGCRGMLPPHWPAYFHNTKALRLLLTKYESEFPFRRKLGKQIKQWAQNFNFQTERVAWKRVFHSIGLMGRAQADA